MAKFYRCKVCGNIVGLIKEGGGTLTCCGEPMEEIIPNTQEGVATEKHIPLVHEENGKVYVQVGSLLHPMVEDHYIEWIYLLTDQGAQRKILKPGMFFLLLLRAKRLVLPGLLLVARTNMIYENRS